MKRVILALLAAAIILAAANSFNTPPTILHVVAVKWKANATPQQQQAAIDALRKLAADTPGVKNLWIRKLKVQPADFSTSFAMEFESKAAFEAYTTSPAHMDWEKIYLPYREDSQTQDITN